MTTLFLCAVIILVGFALLPAFVRHTYLPPRIPEQLTPGSLGLPYRTVGIATANDRRLFAWLIPPAEDREKAPAVAVMHGWGGNAEHMLPFAALLHREGYAVLLLDARNHGSSDVDSFSSMPRFAEDLEHGLDWLGRQPGIDRRRLVLLGHSVGAGAALLVASRRQGLAAVVSIAAFAHPVELMRKHMRSHRVPYVPVGWLVLRYIERTIKARFDDIAPCNTIEKVTCPVLLVHGEGDDRVPLADALRIYANRPDERTELLMLPATGHDSRDAISTHGGSLVAFLRRCAVGSPKPHPSR
ncbi:MAG: alpha/beta fold hydrolase [Pseudomonadota bacterium]|nr:alpha/beta fold hydrolase [Pseudomonadota bacterium]